MFFYPPSQGFLSDPNRSRSRKYPWRNSQNRTMRDDEWSDPTRLWSPYKNRSQCVLVWPFSLFHWNFSMVRIRLCNRYRRYCKIFSPAVILLCCLVICLGEVSQCHRLKGRYRHELSASDLIELRLAVARSTGDRRCSYGVRRHEAFMRTAEDRKALMQRIGDRGHLCRAGASPPTHPPSYDPSLPQVRYSSKYATAHASLNVTGVDPWTKCYINNL